MTIQKKSFILLFILLGICILPFISLAQNNDSNSNEDISKRLQSENKMTDTNNQNIFEAKVIEILKQEKKTTSTNRTITQQNIKLKGLTKQFKDKKIIYKGIGNIEVISENIYQKGDKVYVLYAPNIEGKDKYYIIDYIRRSKLYLLFLIFAILLIIIGKFKGFKSLLSLAITFFIIMNFIIPQILNGINPLFVTIIGSLIILLFIIYLTEGINQKSHLAILAIFISLLFTLVISILFTHLTKLTGTSQEEIMHLIGAGKQEIDFKGLLLAGIIIGTLGVLDDVVISQISAVEQLQSANPDLSFKKIFHKANKIGISHISSMTNTLFLAYAGASLPLLILFVVKKGPFINAAYVINTELIATEIIRTLCGSIGLILAVPIATFLASYYLLNKENKGT
jgi:uncharacterized membrane protein